MTPLEKAFTIVKMFPSGWSIGKERVANGRHTSIKLATGIAKVATTFSRSAASGSWQSPDFLAQGPVGSTAVAGTKSPATTTMTTLSSLLQLHVYARFFSFIDHIIYI